jgi:DNA-binding transcriptional regulator YdaS (Cro superfamily)
MARLIAELDTALEQRAGRRALPADRPTSIASAVHAPFLSHPEPIFAVSEAFCDDR